jgi:hypothetical protein
MASAWKIEGSGNSRKIRRCGRIVGRVEKDRRYWAATVDGWTGVDTSMYQAVWKAIYGRNEGGDVR